MKNLKSLVCAGILLSVLYTPAFAKSGIISTTKAGTISTTRTGTISTTVQDPASSSRTGTISTTRNFTSTSSEATLVTRKENWLIQLLYVAFALW